MGWLTEFAAVAAETDRLREEPDYRRLLALGLAGEAGSVMAEIKKQRRDQDAYPHGTDRMNEEVGDFLWYLTRLCESTDPDLVRSFEDSLARAPSATADVDRARIAVTLVGAVGRVASHLDSPEQLREALFEAWDALSRLCIALQLDLPNAARGNLDKARSRWPGQREYAPLFDEGYPEEEQLPRTLEVEFRDVGAKEAVLRCNGLNFGDRLTDNIAEPDGYRFHDIIHFAHMVHLGWSPVIRALLRIKRKSQPSVDATQDGARAVIVEEAVSAAVFARAKMQGHFLAFRGLDYELLKLVSEQTRGFEVQSVPLWQWEAAILDGHRVFSELRKRGGGIVDVDLNRRSLTLRRG